jgi:peptide/nickel transport system substrate-binding protein
MRSGTSTRRAALGTVALAAALIGASTLSGGAFAAGTTLNVGMASADAGKLDPHLSATTPDKALMGWMFNGLVRFEPGQASPEFIEPDLAESWEASDDGLVWTFHLREGVQCHHGYGELTSADIVYSLERAADPDRSSFSSDFAVFESIEALDERTVRLTLKTGIPCVLGVLTAYHGGNIVCKAAAEELGDQFNTKPIGTGPFMFEEYKPQQSVTLIANPDYFRGAPKLERIVYNYIPSDASRDLAFESGELDLVYGKQDQIWIDRMSSNPDTVVDVMEPAELSNIHLDITKPPLDDIRVRQAIAHAIDRDAMVAFRGEKATRPAISMVPAGYLGTIDAGLPAYDPEKAKALLAEAGYADGVTINAIHTTLPGMLATIEAVQAQLRKVGIDLQIETVEHATFHSQIRDDLSRVTHYSAARFPVADVYLTQFFHSDSIVGTEGAITNFSHCAVADDEITAARSEPDPAKQMELWAAAQTKIAAEVCAVPIYENLQLWARRKSFDYGYELSGSLTLGPVITEASHFTE